MPTILYKTQTMLKAIELLPKRRNFLRDRYFPTNETEDIFPTDEVLVEYRSGSKKLAPCVLPRKKGITIERDGYKTKRYKPPYVAPQRPLTIDDLNLKGFGENLFSGISPAQRQADILRKDLTELSEMIDGREEYMAAQALLNNGYILKHYADRYGSNDFEEWEFRFYEGSTNPSRYMPAISWDKPTADILADLQAMIQMLTSKGLPATDLVVAPNVAMALMKNEVIAKMLDNKGFNIGSFDPTELPNGVGFIGVINVYGRKLSIYTYDETYEDEKTGNLVQFVNSGEGFISSPNAGRGLYAAVTQIESSDSAFHTYMGKRVPKYISDVKSDIRELKLTSRPLYVPNYENPWVSAKFVF